ncbi:MAG: hypothetical protein V1889_00810 [archaeon]
MDLFKFVSPVYLQVESPHRNDVERYSGQGRPIEEDTFRDWMAENSFLKKNDFGSGRISSGIIFGGDVFGGDVLCEVKVNDNILQCFRGGGAPLSDYAYQLRLRIATQPSGRGLPSELVKALDERGYTMLDSP